MTVSLGWRRRKLWLAGGYATEFHVLVDIYSGSHCPSFHARDPFSSHSTDHLFVALAGPARYRAPSMKGKSIVKLNSARTERGLGPTMSSSFTMGKGWLCQSVWPLAPIVCTSLTCTERVAFGGKNLKEISSQLSRSYGVAVMKPSICINEVMVKRVPDTQKNFDMCYCEGCPTYNQCMSQGTEKLYCSRKEYMRPRTSRVCLRRMQMRLSNMPLIKSLLLRWVLSSEDHDQLVHRSLYGCTSTTLVLLLA